MSEREGRKTGKSSGLWARRVRGVKEGKGEREIVMYDVKDGN